MNIFIPSKIMPYHNSSDLGFHIDNVVRSLSKGKNKKLIMNKKFRT